MLYIGRSIIVPLVFAVIIAIVLHPVINFFSRMGIKRVIAIIITIFLTFLVIAAAGGLIISQANKFSQSWPIMVDRFSDLINQAISALSVYADISPAEINAYIEQGKDEMLNLGKAAIGDTIVTIGNTIMVMLLVPVYVFIILFYHSLLVDFLHQVFGKSDQAQVSAIISKTKSVVQRYLAGLIIEAVIIAVMNSVALLALGIEYAILLGTIGALLNVIPYIGGLVAVALPMIVALATETFRHVRGLCVGVVLHYPVDRQQLHCPDHRFLESKDQCAVFNHCGFCRERLMGNIWHVFVHPAARHCQAYF